MKDKYELLHF